MKIHLKSSIFKKGELFKSFHDNFKIAELKEHCCLINSIDVHGDVKEIELNKIYMVNQNLTNNSEGFVLEVSNDVPLCKFHFEFEGDSFCDFKSDEQQHDFKILKGRCNLFFLPKSVVTYKYCEPQKKSLEIYFTEVFIQNIMGLCFVRKFSGLQQAKLNQTIYTFFKGGMYMNDQIETIVKEIMNCEFKGVMKKSFLEVKITELLLMVFAISFQKNTEGSFSELEEAYLKEIEKYIKANLKKDLNISELALLAGMNTSKLKKCFKELYGTTIFKYITSLRIEKAKALIKKEGCTISQASYEVGYKNPQHFTVAFKKKLGYLPRQLKK